MTTKINISVKGIKEVEQNLDRMGRKTQDDISKVVQKYANRLVDDARDYLQSTSPYPTYDTGELDESIKAVVWRRTYNITEMYVVATAPYAIYVAKGRRPGSWPPGWAIKAWAGRKGIVDWWLVSKKIFLKGIKKKPFLREPWRNLRDDYIDEVRAVVIRNSRYWRGGRII